MIDRLLYRGRMVVTVIDRLLCMSRMAESASQKLNSISEQLYTSGTFFKGEPFIQLSYRQSTNSHPPVFKVPYIYVLYI